MLKNLSRFKHGVIDKLSEGVIGQIEPKIALARALENWQNPLFRKKGPIHKALYYGVTGSGKTQLVKELARLMYGDDMGYIHINCETMQYGHEISKLFGSPPGYIGFNKEPMLSSKKVFRSYESARSRGALLEVLDGLGPSSIILFDEIEKAHPKVSQALMTMLDEGIIKLNNGQQVDISNSFVLMTSNIGEKNVSNIRQSVGFNSGLVSDKTSERERAIKSFFSPEFLGRLDGMYEFEKLKGGELYAIVEKLARELREDIDWLWKKNIKIVITKEARDDIVQHNGDSIRDMERYFNDNIRNKLGNIIISNNLGLYEGVKITIDHNGKEFTFN